MGNRNTGATWTYHNGTKHSYLSVRTNAHYLDWDNRPTPFKVYKSIEDVQLPRELESTGMSALDCISHPPVQDQNSRELDLKTLSHLFYFSAGITKQKEYSKGMKLFFRAAACTGALYHIDLYLVCRDLPGLEAGVYQFAPHDFSLKRLRSGDYLSELIRATAGDPSVLNASAVIVCADTFWRNSWKYQARAYRHSFWDSGTILANLLAIASARRVPAKLVLNFTDGVIDRLLGLNQHKEASICMVSLGNIPRASVNGSSPPDDIECDVEPLSKSEVDYSAIRDIRTESSLRDEREVEDLRGPTPSPVMKEPQGEFYPLTPITKEGLAVRPLEETISRRGSTRQFARESITFPQLSNILDVSTAGISTDFLEPFGSTLNQLYLIVNAVEGIPSGSYLFHRDRKGLEQLEEGDYRDKAGYLGLEQAIPADASVDVFFLADLNLILERYGNRGYRMAQLEAGLIGGRLYLAAYGQKLGASGLTFFDDDVIEFFSPSAENKSVMFLVAIGRSIRSKG